VHLEPVRLVVTPVVIETESVVLVEAQCSCVAFEHPQLGGRSVQTLVQ
jgi:hypothetical protein